jgi:hypothetical protein
VGEARPAFLKKSSKKLLIVWLRLIRRPSEHRSCHPCATMAAFSYIDNIFKYVYNGKSGAPFAAGSYREPESEAPEGGVTMFRRTGARISAEEVDAC